MVCGTRPFIKYGGGNIPVHSGAVWQNVTGKELYFSGIPLLYLNEKFNQLKNES
jgi:hypothetical protein